jgi:hypothetical protein
MDMTRGEAEDAASRKGYPNGICKPCCAEWKRERNFIARYNITVEEYEQMLAFQDRKCDICKETLERKKTVVDHCHVSGNVRSLLCHNCNSAIGFIKEDIRTALRLVDYIYVHQKRNADDLFNAKEPIDKRKNNEDNP